MATSNWPVQPRYSLAPFWFWNDVLDERELLRQLADFQSHGVHGVVIHPRMGLPRDIAWLSPRMLELMRTVIDEARRREMFVILYDEGMYPSGSSSGQVVAENPIYACRGLLQQELADGQQTQLGPGENLLAIVKRANGQRMAIIDRRIKSVIRGLHYLDEAETVEDLPPAADLLNPAAVQAFIRLVYDKYAAAFGEHFGKTIPAIFTDEPSVIGRCMEKGIVPGTSDILQHAQRLLGYDITAHLPALWHEDEPDARHWREQWQWMIGQRLDETYYSELSVWCQKHGIALTGHPELPDDLGRERFFTLPGQDLVWRWVLPDQPNALEGPQSTQAKCSSSAAIHQRRPRNLNEFCGAYGHELTYTEMKWLADWCLVRGVNLLVPHAFYYSIRGPRWDERPPDVGPHSTWWKDYNSFADYCSRLCQLNSEGQHICRVAILGLADFLPWHAAKACFENQIDFNYLEARHLWEDARVNSEGIDLADMHYDVLILDEAAGLTSPVQSQHALESLDRAGRLVRFRDEEGLLPAVRHWVAADVTLSPPCRAVRYRHVRWADADYYLLHNENRETVQTALRVSIDAPAAWIDPATGNESVAARSADGAFRLDLDGYALKLLKAPERPRMKPQMHTDEHR